MGLLCWANMDPKPELINMCSHILLDLKWAGLSSLSVQSWCEGTEKDTQNNTCEVCSVLAVGTGSWGCSIPVSCVKDCLQLQVPETKLKQLN